MTRPDGSQASIANQAPTPSATDGDERSEQPRRQHDPTRGRRRWASHSRAEQRRRSSGRRRSARGGSARRPTTPAATIAGRPEHADVTDASAGVAAVAERVGGPGEQEEPAVDGDADRQARAAPAPRSSGPLPSLASPKARTLMIGRREGREQRRRRGSVATAIASAAHRSARVQAGRVVHRAASAASRGSTAVWMGWATMPYGARNTTMASW